MKTLYLAWQDRGRRGWYPIGRLTRQSIRQPEYEFVYVRGAEDARRYANPLAVPVPGFPDLSKAYRASNLFPAFRSRAMNRSRPDLPEYLGALGFHSRNPDVIEELAVSGGHSAKDSYETFPAIEPDRAGRFDARFIVHGLRHEDRISAGKVDSLKPGDRLRLLLESSAPYRSTVVKVATEDEYRLGWLPRYLADVFGRVNRWVVNDVAVRVAQVNPEAPLSHRLLVALKGRLPPGGDPVGELEQYQPISND